MRPTPNELIRGVRELLRDAVAPELSSEQAILTLRRVMVILREVDWDEIAIDFLRENQRLRSLAAEVVAWARAEPDRLARFEADIARLERLGDAPAHAGRFADIRKANRALREAFAALIETGRGTARDAADLRSMLLSSLLEES